MITIKDVTWSVLLFSGKLIALSIPDFYRYVTGLPMNSTVPNVRGSYSQWGYKPAADDGTIDIFLYVLVLYLPL